MKLVRIKYADAAGKAHEMVAETPDLEGLLAALRQQGYYVVSTTVERHLLWKHFLSLLPFGNRVSLSVITEWIKLLRTLIKAGLPLKDALDVLLDESGGDPLLRQAMLTVRNDLVEGTSLSRALARHPNVFPEILTRTVVAGEQSGSLDQVLERVAQYFTRILAVRRRVLMAMIYPTILLCVSMVAVAYLMVRVVPEFKSLFESMETPMPAYTQFVLGIAGFLGDWIVPILIALGAAGYGALWARQTPAGRTFFDGLKLKIPLVNGLEERFALTQFTRTLSTLTAGGIPLLESLGIVVESLENRVIAARFSELIPSIERGESFAKAIRRIERMPGVLVKMIHVGEESGDLDGMLTTAADHFDEEIENQTGTLTAVIEPIMFLSMAFVVGSIIVAMLLPIMTAASHIH